MKKIWEELELDVEYEYSPAQDPVHDVDSTLCGPGDDSRLDITAVMFRNIDILMAFTAVEVEEMEDRLIIEHENDLCDEYEG